MSAHPLLSLRGFRFWALLCLVVVFLLIIAAFISQPGVDRGGALSTLPREDEVVFPVRVAVAQKGKLIHRTEASGIVCAQKYVDIISRVSGVITRTHAQNGMFVHKGDTLVQLDDREYRLAYEDARTALLGSQIEYQTLSASGFLGTVDSVHLLGSIQAAHARFMDLTLRHQRAELPDDIFVREKRDYETTIAYLTANRGDVIAGKSGLCSAESECIRAKLDLDATIVRAPFSGYVANCRLTVSMQVQSGSLLITLIDLSDLLLDVEILESEIGGIAVGQKAEIAVMALPGIVLQGVVTEINPLVDLQTKGVKVSMRILNSQGSVHDRLKPGMYATARIETQVLNDRLLVPRDAILVRDQRVLVFLVRGGYAEWRYVSTGPENEENVEVLSGISRGDSVIIDGHHTLVHDARIRIVEQ